MKSERLAEMYKLCYKKGARELAYSKALGFKNLIYKCDFPGITIQAFWSGRNDLDFLVYWEGLLGTQSKGYKNDKGANDVTVGGTTYHLEWGGDNTGEGSEIFGVYFIPDKKVMVHMNYYGRGSNSPSIKAVVECNGRRITADGLVATANRQLDKAVVNDPGFFVNFYLATSGDNAGKRVCRINNEGAELVITGDGNGGDE